MESIEVLIPTFLTPHLFWIVESKNEQRIQTLKQLNKLMHEYEKDPDTNESFEVDEVVAVEIDRKYYRGIVKDIVSNEAGKDTIYFLCWLVDYGTIIGTETIYKLPRYLNKIKHLAVQACLNGVTYVEQRLKFDEYSGQPVKVNEPVMLPTNISHQFSIELLLNAKRLQFITENKVEGCLLGDILFTDKKGQIKSLRQSLIDKGILMINEELFRGIQEDICHYKERHLMQIVQTCRQLKSYKILEENDCEVTSQKFVAKYLQEFDNRDIFDEEEVYPRLSNRRKRSRNTTASSNNTVSSENESISNDNICKNFENSNNSNDDSKGVKPNRLKMLLEKMKQFRKSSDVSSDDNESSVSNKLFSSSSRDKDESAASVNKESTVSSDVQLNSRLSEDTNDSSIAQPQKRVVPKNAIFLPGGACFTLNNSIKTSTPKPKRRVKKFSSDENSSDYISKKVSEIKAKDIKDFSDENSTTEENKWETKQRSSDEPVEKVNKTIIQPHCSCKRCEHWTHESDWQTSLKFCNEPKEKHLVVAKPQLLFREDEELESNQSIVSLDYSGMTKVQKQAVPKLLVHGECTPHSIKRVFEVNFHQDIHEAMRQGKYEKAVKIQMYAWPAISRYQHVCMVNGPRTGKTMAYLPIMLTFLLEKNERYEQLLKASGPIFIILCANTKKCEEIYDYAKVLLSKNRARISLITYPITHVNTSHIDFLVTTPPVLVDLVKTNAVTFKRLCHLIIEDGDKILTHDSDIRKIFSLTQNMLQNRVHSKPVQLIVCAEHWNLRMERLLKKLIKTPLICIGNQLEAALYGKVQFSVRFVSSACKEQELKNLLKDTHKICKSVVVCKKEELKDIETILMLKGIDATVIHDDLEKEEILYLEQVWTNYKGGQYTVLVCTDFLLNSLLTVTSASLLIHYSLPISWTRFVKRFSCLLENCKSPLDSKESKLKFQSVILCDEECEDNMLKFFNFIDVTELKNQIPDKFKQFSKNLKKMEEQKKLKSEVGLCETLKLLGTCSTVQCTRRHVLDKTLDIAEHLPQSGKIKFRIVSIQDVTTYSIELIEHIGMENTVHAITSAVDVTEDLTHALKVPGKFISTPVVGHLYAYRDELDGICYRCDLLEIDNNWIKMKLIDKGNIINVKEPKLYRLPKEFKVTNRPQKVIDAYLANLIPPYRDENFSAKSFFHLKNLLEKYDYKNIILTATICLQLGNVLWLKDVYEEVVLSDKTIPAVQLTREILQLKLAEYNNAQLISLYKLCGDASITLPTYEKQNAKPAREEYKVEPQWAYLDMDGITEVTFSSAVSPDEIYFRLNKFDHLLYNLQKEIQECLRKPNYPKLAKVEVGTVCLTKGPDEEYSRVIVRKIEDDQALCFCVDFGDEMIVNISELKYIHNKFISQLPFQSIQCKLHGIKPILSEWQNDVTDILYEYAMEPNTDTFRSLFVKCCGKEENITMPKQKKYSVLLKDGFGDKQTLVNNLLIDCGVAIPSSEEISNFEIPESSIEADESDENLEEIINICRKTREMEENFCFDKVENLNGVKDFIEGVELVISNPLDFFEHVMKSEKFEPEPQGKRELPALQAAPPVDYYTPEVLWSQTEEFIKIDIKLSDVEQYNLNLKKGRILNFKTVTDEKTYLLTLMLYEKVDTIQHTPMGPQIRITLSKSKHIDWPRLILSKQRARNIHYNVSTIKVEEERKKVLELPKMPDDENESDDDKNLDVMYHNCSDIDSDMDLEMPHGSD